MENIDNIFMKLISENISKYGHHIYLIKDNNFPRYAYTIGLHDVKGYELILPGCSDLTDEQVQKIINSTVNLLKLSGIPKDEFYLIEGIGMFKLLNAEFSWIEKLMYGAYDFYKTSKINTFQIIPYGTDLTIDTPSFENAWNEIDFPAWKWLNKIWKFNVPEKSHVITNLPALFGSPITEACRWEEDQWELFAGAGTEILPENARIIPLSTLLATDKTLISVTELKIGEGIWRSDGNSKWNAWNKR